MKGGGIPPLPLIVSGNIYHIYLAHKHTYVEQRYLRSTQLTLD